VKVIGTAPIDCSDHVAAEDVLRPELLGRMVKCLDMIGSIAAVLGRSDVSVSFPPVRN
jgi:hypothetical protein